MPRGGYCEAQKSNDAARVWLGSHSRGGNLLTRSANGASHDEPGVSTPGPGCQKRCLSAESASHDHPKQTLLPNPDSTKRFPCRSHSVLLLFTLFSARRTASRGFFRR